MRDSARTLGQPARMEESAQRPPKTDLGTQNSLARLSGWAERSGQLRGLLLIAVTATTLALLFRQIDLRAVASHLREITAGTWVLAFLLTLSFPVFSALRWRLTLRAIGHDVSFFRCLTIVLGVSPISAIAPSKVGDLLKAISFRGEIGVLEVGGTVLVERALDVILLAAFALVGAIAHGHSLIARAAAVISGVGLIGLLLIPHLVAVVPKPTLRAKLERAAGVLRALRRRPGLAAGMVIYTTANWFASIAQTHLLLIAVGAQPSFLLTTAVLPMAIFVGLLPLTIGGMGTRDAALVSLLAPAATAPQSLAVGLLYSFFGYWLLAVLGLPFLRRALFPPTAGLPLTDRSSTIRA